MTKRIALFSLLSYLVHVGVACLTQANLVNETNVAEVSDRYPSLFTPAAFTFSIWGLIYIALLGFCIYHLVAATKHNDSHPANLDLRRAGPLFIINNIAAALWLLVWVHDLIGISVILIFIQLISLGMIHSRLNIHDHSRSFASKTFTQFPLSIYFGWITIATMANIAVWLLSIGWNGWGVSAINWTITLIAVAVLITVNVINRKKNVFFGIVVIWALYGIKEKRAAADYETFQPVIWVSWTGMAVIALACLFGLIRNLRNR